MLGLRVDSSRRPRLKAADLQNRSTLPAASCPPNKNPDESRAKRVRRGYQFCYSHSHKKARPATKFLGPGSGARPRQENQTLLPDYGRKSRTNAASLRTFWGPVGRTALPAGIRHGRGSRAQQRRRGARRRSRCPTPYQALQVALPQFLNVGQLRRNDWGRVWRQGALSAGIRRPGDDHHAAQKTNRRLEIRNSVR